MQAGVLIIGGGVIGLSIARELHKRGVSRIVVLEKGVCGEESSWAAAGMLGPQVEAEKADNFYQLCSRSRDLYPTFAEELLAETGIDIELDQSGTLYAAFSAEDEGLLVERYKSQISAGMSVERLSADETRKLEPFISPDVRMALLYRNDWQVENRKLLAALLRYADLNDIKIIENTSVESLLVEDGRCIGARTSDAMYTADKTVVATGAWTTLIKCGDGPLPFKITPVRGQIVCYRTAKRLIERVIYSPRGYIVPRSDGRILVGSTTENTGFSKGVTEEAASDLSKVATEIIPSLINLQVIDQWSGLRPMAPDGMPIIGELGGHADVYFSTGHYRNGILLAPISGSLAADHLLGERTDKLAVGFGPDRFGRGARRSAAN